MLNPSKSDCITILSAASELADDSMLPLDAGRLGLSRNGMLTAAAFLIERACFRRHRKVTAIMPSAACRCRDACGSTSSRTAELRG